MFKGIMTSMKRCKMRSLDWNKNVDAISSTIIWLDVFKYSKNNEQFWISLYRIKIWKKSVKKFRNEGLKSLAFLKASYSHLIELKFISLKGMIFWLVVNHFKNRVWLTKNQQMQKIKRFNLMRCLIRWLFNQMNY